VWIRRPQSAPGSPGSAIEGINGPLAIFGTLTQSVLPGQPGFLTTQTGFASGIASTFNPINSNSDYIPANTRWPYIQSWLLSIQRQLAKGTVLEIAYNSGHWDGGSHFNHVAANPTTRGN